MTEYNPIQSWTGNPKWCISTILEEINLELCDVYTGEKFTTPELHYYGAI